MGTEEATDEPAAPAGAASRVSSATLTSIHPHAPTQRSHAHPHPQTDLLRRLWSVAQRSQPADVAAGECLPALSSGQPTRCFGYALTGGGRSVGLVVHEGTGLAVLAGCWAGCYSLQPTRRGLSASRSLGGWPPPGAVEAQMERAEARMKRWTALSATWARRAVRCPLCAAAIPIYSNPKHRACRRVCRQGAGHRRTHTQASTP